MGLDVVELVMAFEEKFAITIPDAEAEEMGTPRHVIDFIYANVQHADSKTCLSQRAFYRLRRALQQELGLGRNAVRPTTTLNAIIPLNERQSVWERIKRAAGIGRWPRLVRSQQVVLGCGLASLAVGFVVYAANPPFPDWMAVLAATGSATALAGATEHLRLHFTAPETVGQLAEFWVAQDPTALQLPDHPGWSREQVRTIVRAIIVDHLNVPPDFSDDASFIDDLGAD